VPQNLTDGSELIDPIRSERGVNWPIGRRQDPITATLYCPPAGSVIAPHFLFERVSIMSEDHIINFVDRLIAKQQPAKKTDDGSEFLADVENFGALIENELRDLPLDQRISLASVLANALAAAVIQMHQQHGASRVDIVRALAAAAKLNPQS
jgi:hypothetical protein